MTIADSPSIACTLTPGDYKARLGSIAALAREALRSHTRGDLELELVYAANAAERVREMVRKEQDCCAFLTFDLVERADEIRLTIKAPERAREAADMLFGQFLPAADYGVGCGCPSYSCGHLAESPAPAPEERITPRRRPTRAAGALAMIAATGAVACAACCVLPIALPAVVVAGFGGLLALLAGALAWVSVLAAITVAGAWAWVGWRSAQSQARPAAWTLYMMAGATALTAVALTWPRIEPILIPILLK